MTESTADQSRMPAAPAAGKVRPFTVTHGLVLSIAMPMTLAHLSTPLLGITDTAVIGRLGDAALLGGIAVGAVIFDLVFATFSFLRIGTIGLTAQAFGAGDEIEQRAVLWRALIIACVCGLAAILLQVPILAASLWVMGASEAVSAATTVYFDIRIVSAPLTLINYVVLGWFLGIGRAGVALALQTLLNGLNIALTISFVLGLGWGIAGAAWATVVAEGVTAVVGLGFCWLALKGKLSVPRAIVLDRVQLLRTFAVNRDIMIRSLCLVAAFTLFTSAGARQGDLVLAANAILFNFFFVASYFLDGFASAAEQLTGRAVGARYRPAFERAVKLNIGWGFAVALPASIIMYLFGTLLIDLITTNPDVRETARLYLIWAALTPVAGVLAFQFDGIFIGATWSDDMRNMMLISLAAFIVVWQTLQPILGNHGVWIALLVFLGARGITLLWRYRVRLERTFPLAETAGA